MPRPIFIPYIPGVSTNNEIVLLQTKAMRDEYAHPTNTCRQNFIIRGADSMVWNIDFPPDAGAFGALVLRSANDLSACRTRGIIRMRIKPGHAAAQLRVGLMDSAGVLSDAPMAAPSAGADEGWRFVDLPLTAFAERGVSSARENAGTIAPLDWTAISEFRIITSGRVAAPVSISLLRIVKEP